MVKRAYFVYEKNKSWNHLNFFLFRAEKNILTEITNINKNQHVSMRRNFLSEIFRIADVFFASGNRPLEAKCGFLDFGTILAESA